jgi:pseudouridine-5'-phosphate glycosidase
MELARTPVAVVCAGAKSILDIPRTLEILETEGVPVLGFGTNEFPAFYVRSSGEPAARIDTVEEAATVLAAHWSLGGAGALLAQPVEEAVALSPAEFNMALEEAEVQAQQSNVRGPALTPFLLARLGEITQGRTLEANWSLLMANARLAARVAVAFAKMRV